MALAKVITIEEEIKKNPELKESDLDILREWHKKQPHLPPISDYELTLFLHSNNYRIEPTKITIDTFFTVRTHVPEYFSKRDPLASKEIREIMKLICCVSLPSTTPDGYKIIFSSLIDCDPSHYMYADSMKLILMVVDLMLYNTGTNYPGYVVVIDMEGSGLGHVACINPMLLKKFLYYLQEAIPIRLKRVHFINAVSCADLLMNIARPFLKKELLDMVFFHKRSDRKKMSKMVPIDALPNEQGGKAGPLEELWSAQVKELEDHREWFQKEETRKVNESVRPGKAINATDVFGVEGSFKKLDID